MWIYVQRTGNIYRRDGADLQFLTQGYSGRGAFINDPEAQCRCEFGPLPRGSYSFSAPTTFNFMADCLRLTPAAGNDMCNPARSGFWLHDGIFSGPHGNSSHGCICLHHPARLVMWQSGDHALEVVAEDPQPLVAAAAPDDASAPQAVMGESAEAAALVVPTADAETFTLHKNRRYRAVVTLGLFEQLAGNDVIAGLLQHAGFQDVSVTGMGATRTAEATWPGVDVTGPVDPHLSDIQEMQSV